MGPIEVSIIVANYNACARLRACLESIYAHPPSLPFEVVVIDDASHDDSAAMVREEFPQASLLVNEQNLGYGASCNRAIAESRGRLIHLLNNDVELLPGAVDALAELLDGQPDAGAAGSLLFNGDGTIQASVKARPSLRSGLFGARSPISRWFPANRWTRRELLHWKAELGRPFTADYVSSASMMLPRRDLELVGHLDTRLTYFVDADLCRKLWDAGRAIYYVPGARAVHHAHQGGTLVSLRRRFLSVVEFHTGAYRYFCRHESTGRWHAARAAVIAVLALRFVPSVLLWLALESVRALLPSRRAPRPRLGTEERAPSPAGMPVDVSVVIANYKAPEPLERCLRSIHGTPWSSSYEVIVVDDASNDESCDVIATRFADVTLLRNRENIGYGASCNRGIARSRGRFVYLLNNDAELLPGVLDELVGFLESHPDAGAAGSRLYNSDGTVQSSVKALPSLRSALFGARSPLSRLFPGNVYTRKELLHWKAERDEPFTAGYVSGSSMMVPRGEFDTVGLLEPSLFYFNDADFCMRLWRSNRSVYYVPKARAIHHAHQGGSKVSLRLRFWSLVNFHAGAYRYYRLHGDTPWWHPMNALVIGGLFGRFCLACPLHVFREAVTVASRLAGARPDAVSRAAENGPRPQP